MFDKYDFVDRYIYSLLDPRENKNIVYVGQSINPEKRFKEHLNSCDKNIQKNEWIIELAKENLTPVLKIEKKVCASQFKAFEHEMCVTVKYRNLGYEVLSVRKEKINKIYCPLCDKG